MGPVEEVSKVTSTFIDAMKREPISLALSIVCMSMLLIFYLLLQTLATQREREIALLYSDMKNVRELLAKCVVPQQRTDINAPKIDE